MDDATPVRGSLRSRGAAAVSALTLRQISAVLPPEKAWGLWASRQIVARIMDLFGPSLAGTRVEHVDSRLLDGRRVVGEWVRGPGVQRVDAGVYFVHGSGFALCSPRTHRRLTSWLSSLTGLPVFCVDYRLAPRYRFPTAADDVRAGWDWLVTSAGVAPKRLVVAGDSAGGHLAVDLLLQAEVAAAHPAALVLFSPLVDLTFSLALRREQERRDPAIRVADAARLVGLYSRGVDPAHPRLKLDVAGGPPLPPTLIQAGGAEMLAEDARRLADDIRAAGGSCDLQVWPDQVHVFQALPRLSPEADRAMAYAAQFIATALAARGSHAAEKAG
ncbi:alpha/beta hydrolase [Mycobacterium xenopi]|uniref:Acetylhydrolase n=1 Tax=Mycobacterium xenopi TaxID=1789 RepID=A0AAD1H085_MYCXE|nr:alpha/beta hydrolase [Mycobacterium xenopi]MDA3638383.1 alpha/beta hydrolase [Mycobacterium xenopi]MDA3656452.1 alpha/beta hydrolase [Mycobacterium xenopi]ORX21660.1 acetyl hydrolase [Mycobacterium xenopi]SPX91625.1 lipK [Mycobacterium xenopi]BBU22091.1 acetylhydrolase [Mycobacterium xenopi]